MSVIRKSPQVRMISLGDRYGSLDLDELSRLHVLFRRLAERVDSRVIVLDLSRTEYVGAGFVCQLQELDRQLASKRKHLLICCPNDDVREVLINSGVAQHRVFEDRESVLTAAWRRGKQDRSLSA